MTINISVGFLMGELQELKGFKTDSGLNPFLLDRYEVGP